MNYRLIIWFLISYSVCGQEATEPKNVGDIVFDPALDKENFELCHPNQVYQYFNWGEGLEYEGEFYEIQKSFDENYRPEIAQKESGFVRIRFIVNCKGETDRFRWMSSGLDYQEKILDPSITDQLLRITKNLNGWKLKYYNENKEYPIDYYQYLLFRIHNGEIEKILP